MNCHVKHNQHGCVSLDVSKGMMDQRKKELVNKE